MGMQPAVCGDAVEKRRCAQYLLNRAGRLAAGGEPFAGSCKQSARDAALIHPQRLRVEQLVQLPPLEPVVTQAGVRVRQVEEHICGSDINALSAAALEQALTWPRMLAGMHLL